MKKKILIINGSPRVKGNTAALIARLRQNLDAEITELSAFRSAIAPCVDCRGCWETARCVVKDEMEVIYQDDFDCVVVASPVYFGTLPGQMLSLMSRLQPWHAATYFLKQPLQLRPKKAAVILTAGGKGNEGGTHHHLRALFKMLNATGFEEHTVCSGRTDTHPAEEDEKALAEVDKLAQWLMAED